MRHESPQQPTHAPDDTEGSGIPEAKQSWLARYHDYERRCAAAAPLPEGPERNAVFARLNAEYRALMDEPEAPRHKTNSPLDEAIAEVEALLALGAAGGVTAGQRWRSWLAKLEAGRRMSPPSTKNATLAEAATTLLEEFDAHAEQTPSDRNGRLHSTLRDIELAFVAYCDVELLSAARGEAPPSPANPPDVADVLGHVQSDLRCMGRSDDADALGELWKQLVKSWKQAVKARNRLVGFSGSEKKRKDAVVAYGFAFERLIGTAEGLSEFARSLRDWLRLRAAEAGDLTLLDRFPATPAGNAAFLEFVRDEVHGAAEAKRKQHEAGYENATLESMVRGIKWAEARRRATMLDGLPAGALNRVAGLLAWELTLGTVEELDRRLPAAVAELRSALMGEVGNPAVGEGNGGALPAKQRGRRRRKPRGRKVTYDAAKDAKIARAWQSARNLTTMESFVAGREGIESVEDLKKLLARVRYRAGKSRAK